MELSVERVIGLIEKLSIVIKGLRFAALVFASGALLGALLFWVGLATSFGPWWLGLIPAIVLSIPALGLWRFRAALEPTLELPDRLRALPTSTEEVGEEFSGVVEALGEVKENPWTPRAFWRSAKASKSVLDWFQASAFGSVAIDSMALHPAALVAGATTCAFAAGAFVLGAFVFALSLLF